MSINRCDLCNKKEYKIRFKDFNLCEECNEKLINDHNIANELRSKKTLYHSQKQKTLF